MRISRGARITSRIWVSDGRTFDTTTSMSSPIMTPCPKYLDTARFPGRTSASGGLGEFSTAFIRTHRDALAPMRHADTDFVPGDFPLAGRTLFVVWFAHLGPPLVCGDALTFSAAVNPECGASVDFLGPALDGWPGSGGLSPDIHGGSLRLSDERIATEETGFYHKGEGDTRPRPSYGDLLDFFRREHRHRVLEDSGVILAWDGVKYVDMPESRILEFSDRHFKPRGTQRMRREFLDLMKCNDLVSQDFFETTTKRRINFSNGVYDLDADTFGPHDPAYGFRKVLPYTYDPKARCLRFQNFMADITCLDDDVYLLLLQFMGYALSNDDCWAQKALVLYGDGENGKSTFIEVLKMLAGEDNYTSMPLSDMTSETSLQLLDGVLFNIGEETSYQALEESSLFKVLVAGGEVKVRALYRMPYMMRSRAKIIFSCNELPRTGDSTHAFYRRLLIAPFNATFSHEKGNRDDTILDGLATELPGIFNLVIQAYRTLRKLGRFRVPEASANALKDYREETDSVLRFIGERKNLRTIKISGEELVIIKDVYADFRQVMEDEGERRIPSAVEFGRKLSKVMPGYKEKVCKRTINGVSQRVILMSEPPLLDVGGVH